MPRLPDYDEALLARVVFLFRLEAMLEICSYGPDDLEASTWDHLLILKAERNFVDRLLDKRRDKGRRDDALMHKARAVTGAPAPGGTLFRHSKPFRGSTK